MVIENTRSVLELPNEVDCDFVMQKIAELKSVVVINIANSPDGGDVLFTLDNLQILLAADTRKLYLETMEEKQYGALMGQHIAQLLLAIEQLENQLRDQYITDLFVSTSDLLFQLQNLVVTLTCFALQKKHTLLSESLETLRQFKEQLSNTVFFLEDNVRCLDDLHYEIVPCLQKIKRQLKK
jgi:hypothetical protein